MSDYALQAQEEMWDAIAASDPGHCTTCGRPVDDPYVNPAAGERCVDPCHPDADREKTIERWMRESAVMTVDGLSRAEAERAYDAGAR